MFKIILSTILIVTYIADSAFLKDDNRIVGGTDVCIEDVPYQAGLFVQFSRMYYFVCGGSIISKHVVITAARCLSVTNNYMVGVGSKDKDEPDLHHANRFLVHEHYDEDTRKHDIGLVYLAKDLTFSDRVQPIGLPVHGEELAAGELVVVTGWGSLYDGGNFTNKLQLVEMPIVGFKTCNDTMKENITKDVLCAGSRDGRKDACQGDTGGPLVTFNKLYGITSWNKGCARTDKYGVYTKVSSYIYWIDSKIQDCNSKTS